jgi:DNA-binding HxlR family transcriptional regulator
VQDVVAGKWKIIVIWRLKDGVKRFGELQRSLGEIRQSTLTQQLKELERDGLVHREAYKEVPPKVEYSLTMVGREFLNAMVKLGEWGYCYIDYLKQIEAQADNSKVYSTEDGSSL